MSTHLMVIEFFTQNLFCSVRSNRGQTLKGRVQMCEHGTPR